MVQFLQDAFVCRVCVCLCGYTRVHLECVCGGGETSVQKSPMHVSVRLLLNSPASSGFPHAGSGCLHCHLPIYQSHSGSAMFFKDEIPREIFEARLVLPGLSDNLASKLLFGVLVDSLAQNKGLQRKSCFGPHFR